MKNYEKYEYEKRMKNSFFAKDHENIFFSARTRNIIQCSLLKYLNCSLIILKKILGGPYPSRKRYFG